MATIITRETGATAVNRPLTNAELDNNFINLNADVATRILSSEKAAVNGVATLDATGKVPSTQLPSYVDDVLEAANLAAFPATGETGKIYVALDTNKTYRWSGSAYVYITSGAVDSVAGKTGVVTLTKSDVGLSSVDNTADSDKNVLSATKWTTARTLSISGDLSGSASIDGTANVTITGTLPATGVSAASYGSATAIPVITVDAKGRLTAVSTVAVSIPSGSISVTGGDFTLSGTTGTAITNATLATVNSNVGTFNNLTVNAKGLVTAASNAAYALSTDITPLKKQEFTATAAQTTFSISSGYTVGTVQVFANGIALAAADFTATNGTTVVLTDARVAGDNIIISSGGAFQAGVATLTGTETLTNKTITSGILLGTLSAGGSVGTSGQVLTSTGSGVQWSTASSGGSSLPTQTGNAGKMLITDGTTTSWSGFTSTLFNVGSRPYISGTKQFLYSDDAGSSFAWIALPEYSYRYIWLNSSSAFSASGANAVLRFKAGTNVTITAETNGSDSQSYNTLVFNSSGGSSSGITWTANSTSGGSITVTNPTGYSTSGSTMIIVVVGSGATTSSASSGSGSFSTAASVGSNTRVFYTYTTSSLGATTTISGISGYAMAYAYIGGGASISTSSTSISSTSGSISAPSPQSGSPRIIAVSTSSSLNLATVASTASGGGPTWATGSGFQHPSDSSLSAAVWVGTGSWTTTATPTLTSNSFMSWYITGITTTS